MALYEAHTVLDFELTEDLGAADIVVKQRHAEAAGVTSCTGLALGCQLPSPERIVAWGAFRLTKVIVLDDDTGGIASVVSAEDPLYPYLLRTAVHELGHAIGLPHSSDIDSVMREELDADTPTQEEYDLINQKYTQRYLSQPRPEPGPQPGPPPRRDTLASCSGEDGQGYTGRDGPVAFRVLSMPDGRVGTKVWHPGHRVGVRVSSNGAVAPAWHESAGSGGTPVAYAHVPPGDTVSVELHVDGRWSNVLHTCRMPAG